MGNVAPLTPAQRRALAWLKRAGLLDELYLAGGVAVAHRPLVRPTRGPEGVHVASLRDLAVMKLAAIARRGLYRDYWDLYWILTRTNLRLSAVCDDYVRKFGVSEADLYHVLRALTWFEDAEADPKLPRGLRRSMWLDIRAWFEREAGSELIRRSK